MAHSDHSLIQCSNLSIVNEEGFDVLDMNIPGFSSVVQIPFPDGKLPVCEACKRNCQTRKQCRALNLHRSLPWSTTFLCATFDSTCFDTAGNLSQSPLTANIIPQSNDYCFSTWAEASIPICVSCKKKNYTRNHCRNKMKHKNLPWGTSFVMLSVIGTTECDQPDKTISTQNTDVTQVNGEEKIIIGMESCISKLGIYLTDSGEPTTNIDYEADVIYGWSDEGGIGEPAKTSTLVGYEENGRADKDDETKDPQAKLLKSETFHKGKEGSLSSKTCFIGKKNESYTFLARLSSAGSTFEWLVYNLNHDATSSKKRRIVEIDEPTIGRHPHFHCHPVVVYFNSGPNSCTPFYPINATGTMHVFGNTVGAIPPSSRREFFPHLHSGTNDEITGNIHNDTYYMCSYAQKDDEVWYHDPRSANLLTEWDGDRNTNRTNQGTTDPFICNETHSSPLSRQIDVSNHDTTDEWIFYQYSKSDSRSN